MKAIVFPGQGSQVKGMGGELFNEFPELTQKADQILGYSIKDLCLENREGGLGQTQYTQPALYTVNALMYLHHIQMSNQKPYFVAGHSLGEYNALFAAGAFDFETGLKLVKRRGELMAEATGGGMLAVIGIDAEKLKEIILQNNLEQIDLANYNTPYQTIISGKQEDIKLAMNIIKKYDRVTCTPLNVSGAFHSRYMLPAKKQFEELLNTVDFKTLAIPVIANFTARPYVQNEIRKTLAEQMTGSVRWTETIRYLMGKGIEDIEQIGPGNALKGMIVRIKRETQPLIVKDEKIETTFDSTNSAITNQNINIKLDKLGSPAFKERYGLKYPYVAGAMYMGITSKEMVVRMGKVGMLGFFGTGGLDKNQIIQGINDIQESLKNNEPYGMNFLSFPSMPQKEEEIIDIFLTHQIKLIEASAFMMMTPALVKFRLKGLTRNCEEQVTPKQRIIAKFSRPEVATLFLSPAPERIVQKLLQERKITQEEAELSKEIPMADDLTIEADSGGHTDGGVAYVLIPSMIRLRNEYMAKYNYKNKICIGAAGGIGSPEAVVAAFMLGADYVVTGSINQCTVEARTSEGVKNILESIDIQDTQYAPAGDMFELGAKVQVAKKGLFFSARANKLYELYRQYNSLDEIDSKVSKQLQERYFKKTYEEIFDEAKKYYSSDEINQAQSNPKYKMAMIFKWYFNHATVAALTGNEDDKMDYQIQCGPALGAFNRWAKGKSFEHWKQRHVDEIAQALLNEAALILNERFKTLI